MADVIAGRADAPAARASPAVSSPPSGAGRSPWPTRRRASLFAQTREPAALWRGDARTTISLASRHARPTRATASSTSTRAAGSRAPRATPRAARTAACGTSRARARGARSRSAAASARTAPFHWDGTRARLLAPHGRRLLGPHGGAACSATDQKDALQALGRHDPGDAGDGGPRRLGRRAWRDAVRRSQASRARPATRARCSRTTRRSTSARGRRSRCRRCAAWPGARPSCTTAARRRSRTASEPRVQRRRQARRDVDADDRADQRPDRVPAVALGPASSAAQGSARRLHPPADGSRVARDGSRVARDGSRARGTALARAGASSIAMAPPARRQPTAASHVLGGCDRARVTRRGDRRRRQPLEPRARAARIDARRRAQVLPEVQEDVDEPAPCLRRRAQRTSVIATAPDAPPPPDRAVDGLRAAGGHPCTRARGRAVRLPRRRGGRGRSAPRSARRETPPCATPRATVCSSGNTRAERSEGSASRARSVTCTGHRAVVPRTRPVRRARPRRRRAAAPRPPASRPTARRPATRAAHTPDAPSRFFSASARRCCVPSPETLLNQNRAVRSPPRRRVNPRAILNEQCFAPACRARRAARRRRS